MDGLVQYGVRKEAQINMTKTLAYVTIAGTPRRQRDALLVPSGVIQSPNASGTFEADAPLLVAVADGVGLRPAAGKVSQIVLRMLAERIQEGARLNTATLRQVHDRLCGEADEDRRLRRAATTLAAAWIENDTVTVANVGDSRVYLLDREAHTIKQLSYDHTVLLSMREDGLVSIDVDEHDLGRLTHVLLDALVADDAEHDFAVHVTSCRLSARSAVLLCTDGVTEDLRDAQILDIFLGSMNASEAAQRIMDAVIQAGAPDNATLVIVESLEERIGEQADA
jgi:serine/threonine protein phosphatase PrpC